MLSGLSVLEHFIPRKVVKVANASLVIYRTDPKCVPPFPGGVGNCKLDSSMLVPWCPQPT